MSGIVLEPSANSLQWRYTSAPAGSFPPNEHQYKLQCQAKYTRSNEWEDIGEVLDCRDAPRSCANVGANTKKCIDTYYEEAAKN